MTYQHHSVSYALTNSAYRFLGAMNKGSYIFSRCVGLVRRNVRQAICLILVLSLLSTSMPAAPQTIMGLVSDWSTSLKFWFHQSGWAAEFQQGSGQERPPRKSQEKQEDRNARVTRIEIYPGDVTVQVDEQVAFAAVAFDQNGNPIGGVRVKWSCQDEDRNQAAQVSQRGDFVATIPGKFKVTAETEGGKRAHVKVTVTEGAKRRRSDRPERTREVSTRDQGKVASAQLSEEGGERKSAHASSSRRLKRASSSHAANSSTAVLPLPPDDGWNGSNYWSADDPGNTRGNPPGAAQDDGAGSGNFQIAAPVLSLPGRGIDIGLGLAYNSRVWNKANSQLTFDIDRDWPAPGWSLGFGKIVGMGVDQGSMIVDADGTRHGYAGTVVYGPNQNYTDFTGHTTDGTFIDYSHHTGLNGVMTSAQAKYPNGTVIEYGAQGVGAMYPTRITDSNGNYITVTYVNNQGPQIQTITDTLGRLINFYYDTNNLLTAITAPALGTGTRTLVRLHYKQLTLSPSFSGPPPVIRNSTPWVIDAIYYPATGTGYWFGDTDSYSSYGMITKAVEQRGMSFSASSLSDQGGVTPGSMTRQEVYTFQYTNLTDAPTFTSMTETWTTDGVNTEQAVTNYEVHEDSTPRTVKVTLPNGTKSIQYSYNYSSLPQTDPLKALDGLVYLDETRDSNNALLQSSTATWEPGAYGSPRPTRVEATDERNQTTATAFSYGSVYNQVIEARNYDYGGQTLLRATRTQYENSANYTNRHIFNLPTVVEVYASDNTTRVSRTEYHYDEQTLTDTPNVVMHDETSNPYAPQLWIPGRCHCEYNEFGYCTQVCDPGHYASAYDPATSYRGLVTQVTRYANAGTEPASGAITETRRYDITGNLVTASTSCCQQTSVSYTSATQYAYPLSQTRGSSDPNSPIRVTTSATYDFNTGLGLSSTDPNGRVSQTTYFADTLRPNTVYSPTNAYVSYEYDEAAMSVTETTREADVAVAGDGKIADQNVKLLNGRGQVRREKALGVNNVWDMVDVQYDALGRVTQQSLPYRSGDTIKWSVTTYDALGRVKSTQAPDGSTTQAFYNETARPSVATNAPGQTTRVVDAWGRERWGRTDASDRLVEVVEPKWDGDGTVALGGYLTTYSYDTLGNLTGVSQGAQTRSFRYDSLGRMTRQKLAEANATLNDNGQYVTSGGTWSDFFTYDDRSNLTSRTDARGVKTVFAYNNDPLNRLQSVSFDTTGFGDTAHPILAAPPITYAYMTTGDITRLSSVTTDGVSTDSFAYDSEGRLATRTQTILSRSGYPMVTDYIYDTLDRVTEVRYPNEYGTGTAPRKVVTHTYDIASRLSGLKVNDADYASQIVYNAASQTTSLQVGTSGANQINESYDYDPQTGLLTGQKVWRGTGSPINPLLDLSYDYLRPNTTTGRTGQLTRIINNRDNSRRKDRNYEYDALGRLVKATGGTAASPIWTETYAYDQYGNRLSVTSSGNTAKLEKPEEPQVQLPTELLARKTIPLLPDELRNDPPQTISDSSFAHGAPPPRRKDETGSRKPSDSSNKQALEKPEAAGEPLSLPQTSPPAENVVWTNAVGVAVNGNNLTRSGAASAWNSGASSTKAIASGDGYVEFTVSESGYRMCGLSNGDTDQNYSDIDFALYPSANGTLNVYEGGVWRGALTNYAVGDVFRVAVEGGVVKYRQNGTLIYTSGLTPTYPLRVDSSLYTPSSTINNAVISGNLVQVAAGAENVTWTNPHNVIPSGNTLTRSATPDGWNAGASSTKAIASGDGYMEFTVAGGGYRMCGLSSGTDADQNYAEINYDIFLSANGTLNVYEGTTWRGEFGTYATGDVLRVAVEGGVVKYRKNGAVIYTSTVAPSYPLRVDTSLYTQNSTINNVIIYGILQSAGNQPPVANAGGPYSGTTGAAIQFSGSQSSDADGTITSYQWSFGDQTSGTGATPTHAYTAAGTYTATLTVTDNSGATASNTASVSVTAAAQPIPRDGLASLTYNAQTNRITSAGYEYDAAGNQTRVVHDGNQIQRYQYDAAGRLVNVKTDNNVLISNYTYGASNQRLITTEGNLQTYYAWSGEATVAEYTEVNSSGAVTWSKSYVYLGERLLATLQPNGSGGEFTQFHHPDRLGTRLITNASDATYQEQVNLPYGTALNAESTGSTNRRFTSYDRSTSTGLDYAINRHYDSQQGRFTQVDPIGMGGASLSNPQSLNLYAYCGNDPINHLDPNGLFWGKLFRWIGKVFKWVMVAVAVALIIIASISIGAPGISPWLIAKLFIEAGMLLAQAFGPPKVRIIVGLLGLGLGIYQQAHGSSFASGASSNESLHGLSRLSPWLAALGSIVNYLQGRDKKKGTRHVRRKKEVENRSVFNPVEIAATIMTVISTIRANPPRDLKADSTTKWGYTAEACKKYDELNRPDLGGICRSFGEDPLSQCTRKCLLDNFGPDPIIGRTGIYKGPGEFEPVYGPLTHHVCISMCGDRVLRNQR